MRKKLQPQSKLRKHTRLISIKPNNRKNNLNLHLPIVERDIEVLGNNLSSYNNRTPLCNSSPV